jgi:hypothetical protein
MTARCEQLSLLVAAPRFDHFPLEYQVGSSPYDSRSRLEVPDARSTLIRAPDSAHKPASRHSPLKYRGEHHCEGNRLAHRRDDSRACLPAEYESFVACGPQRL